MSELNEVESKIIDSETIDIEQYVNTIKRYFWRIFGLAIFTTLICALFVFSMTPIFTSKATMLIESDKANVLSIEEIYGLDSSRKEYFQTQYEILRSKRIARKVVESLELYKFDNFNHEYNQLNKGIISDSVAGAKNVLRTALPFLPQKQEIELSEEEKFERDVKFATSVVGKNLTINPLVNTQVVELAYEDQNPKRAAQIANTVAEVYIKNYLESKLEMTAKATEWLNESLQGLRNKLNAAEKNLADFYEREQVVDIDGVVGLASDKLQNLSNQLIDAQILVKRNEAIFNQVTRANVSLDELSRLPDVLNHPSIRDLKRAEVSAQSRISELKEVYGPKHPRMIAANAELTSIAESVESQIQLLISSIRTEYESANMKLAALTRDVDAAKSEFRVLSNLESSRRTLQREVDINQQLYDSFFTRLKETDQIGGFESANARLIDFAAPPTFPSKPKKGFIIIGVFIASFGFGVFLAISLEALNSGIRSTEDVERKLAQRMLGIIPWQPHKKKENLALRHFFDNKHHIFSESVRTLRTSLQLLNLDKPSQTILVTSSVPKEGKSTVSINLAFAMGQLSKVLILDTDLRRPSIGKQFDLPGFQPGLANLIAGTHKLEECIVTDEKSGIDVIGAGTLPPNPQELLASTQFKILVDELRSKYDHIIMDSAPTQAVSDSVLVSKHCDSVLYVVRADSTSHKIINQGLSRFLQIGHRVDGVVLNQVDLNKAKKTGAYSGFYDQYGYNSYSQNSYQSNQKP